MQGLLTYFTTISGSLFLIPIFAQSYDPYEPGGVSPFTDTGPDTTMMLLGAGFLVGIFLILFGLTGTQGRKSKLRMPDPGAAAATVRDKDFENLIYHLVELTEHYKHHILFLESAMKIVILYGMY